MFTRSRGDEMVGEEETANEGECKGYVALIRLTAIEGKAGRIMHDVRIRAVTTAAKRLGHHMRRKDGGRDLRSVVTFDVAKRRRLTRTRNFEVTSSSRLMEGVVGNFQEWNSGKFRCRKFTVGPKIGKTVGSRSNRTPIDMSSGRKTITKVDRM